jgi:hypothetical protein
MSRLKENIGLFMVTGTFCGSLLGFLLGNVPVGFITGIILAGFAYAMLNKQGHQKKL